MSGPKPQFVANLIIEHGRNPDSINLERVVVSVMKQRLPDLSEDQIWEWNEAYLKDVANELYEKTSDSQSDAVKVNFVITEQDDGFYIRFLDSPGIRLLRRLQSGTPSEFEDFCGEVLAALGGTKNVTGASYDRGVDFWSSEIMLSRMTYHSTLGSKVLVVGQAKRYADGNHVSEVELREFVGASLRRLAELKRTHTMHFGLFQPSVLAFWTTSDFHRNAKIYAKEMGIWYLSGVALCQLATTLGFEDE